MELNGKNSTKKIHIFTIFFSDLTCKIEENMTTFEFQFDLRDFKNNGFKQLTAEITIRPDPENPIFELIHRKLDILDIDEHRVNFSVENKNTQSLAETRAILELILTPIREKFSYREMFMPSQKTDAILMIGGEKLHVNKAVSLSKFTKNPKTVKIHKFPVPLLPFGLLPRVVLGELHRKRDSRDPNS